MIIEKKEKIEKTRKKLREKLFELCNIADEIFEILDNNEKYLTDSGIIFYCDLMRVRAGLRNIKPLPKRRTKNDRNSV